MSEAKASSKSTARRHHGQFGRVPTAIVGVIVMFLIAIAVNYIAKAVGGRWDLTENKVYTLSNGTRNILKRIDTPVAVRFYTNDSSDFMSPAEIAYSKRVEDLLNEYQKASGGKLTVKKLDPEPSTDAEDSAILDGLQRGLSRETGNEIFLGIAVSCVDETEVIPFLPARPETLMEYDLSRAIARVHDGAGSIIRIMTTMQIGGGFSGNPMMGGGSTPAWFFVEELRRDYTVEFLPATAEEIPADTETLVVLHPYDVTEETQYAIDQYLLKGGKVIAAVDPSFFYARAMGAGGNPMQAQGGPAPSSNLNKLFEAWGVKYDDTKVVADNKFATEIIRQGYVVPTFLSMNQDAFPSDDPIVKFIQNAQFLTPGGFTISPPEGVTKEDLVTTSPDTQLVGSFEADPTQEDSIKRLRDDFQPSGTTYSIISRLSGSFKTAFPDGNPADAAKKEDAAADAEKKDGEDAKKEEGEKKEDTEKKPESLKASEKDGVVLLISDVDFLYDAVCVRLNQIPGLGIRIPEPLNGNLSLVQNAIDQLSGDPELINVRSRSSGRRPFTKLNEWLAQAESKFRGELSEFEAKAKDAESRVNEILSQTPGNVQDALLSPEVQAELEKLRKEQVSMNKKVRELNKEMKRDFDLVQNLIKLLTTGLMPLLVIIVGVALALTRRFKTAAR
ncbi:MAG: Gldg family protein [Verrucomicrobiae bacterium]|nr:Gldg family protein [Verrucomicrobiae bacterium]